MARRRCDSVEQRAMRVAHRAPALAQLVGGLAARLLRRREVGLHPLDAPAQLAQLLLAAARARPSAVRGVLAPRAANRERRRDAARARGRARERVARIALLGLALARHRMHRLARSPRHRPGSGGRSGLIASSNSYTSGTPVGTFSADDRVVRHAVEVLDQRAQAVAVRGDEHALARGDTAGAMRSFQYGTTRATVSFRHSVSGTSARGELRVARVVARRRAHRLRSSAGGRRVVAAAPDQHLRFAELRRGLGLVEALQRAVVALVQAPVLLHRQPQAVHFLERDVERADRALEHRGIGDVEIEAFVLSAAGPAARASSTPLAVRSTSVQPVKRFSWFHVLSPWRSSTSLFMRAV